MESNGKNKKPEEKVGPIESTDETKVSKDGDCKGQTDDSEKFESGSQQGAENEEEIEEVYSERVKEERMRKAEDIKEKGTSEYKQGNYETAVDHYTEAMKICPKVSTKLLATLFGNRSACYFMMKEHLSAIKDCTSALELDQSYLKVRIRRAQAYEVEEKLEEAFEDYKKILEQDRTCRIAIEAVKRLPDQINEKNEKLKEEMMGKLKDLGNMFLKPFGLSTENFKMQQDPSTGGYTINFQK